MTARQAARREGGVPVWAIALALAIPFAIVVAYGALIAPASNPVSLHAQGGGPAPAAASAPPRETDAVAPPDIDQMVARLVKRLESQPDDANGWSTLAHTYYVLKRFPEAVAAYERLVALGQPDAATLADYADALAMAQGRTLSGKPMELVEQALRVDPKNWKALSMAGTEAFGRRDYRAAVGYWQRARDAVPPDSDNARMLDSNIAEAKQLAGTAR